METFPTTTLVKNTIRTFKLGLANFTLINMANTISTFQTNKY